MTTPLKILMIEDIVNDAELMKRELIKANMEVTVKIVGTKSEYINELSNFKPDVILADHTLPQFDSKEALKIFLNHKLNIPFILVTGTVSEEFAVSILHEGADDYILKDSLTRLPSAIQNALKKRDAEAQKEIILETLKNKNAELLSINQELDHLVYSASHDLRAPISTILGLIYIMKIEPDIEKLKGYNDLIEKTIYKLDNTIKDIIVYSNNRRKEISIEELDLPLLLNEIIEDLKPLYEEKNPEFKIEVEKNFKFHSDKERIKIIFKHIILNAIIYGNMEKPLISININLDPEKAIVSILDNGEGIPDIHITKIFDMFYKASLKSQGSGLGLYLVREAIRKLNGEIRVDTVIGKGTAFIVQIPNR